MPHKKSIWERVLLPQEPDMPAEVAKYFLSIGIETGDMQRYTDLASMEQTDLSTEQRSELEELVQANTLLMLLQAKARLSLTEHQSAA